MQATHYYETYRQLDKNKIVTGPLLKMDNLENSLAMTKASNCKTVAVFKIKYKPEHLNKISA